jgi:hypothetical protein
VSILTTCAAHRNLWDFINITIFFFLIRISSFSFVFILHVPSLSSVAQYIFLSSFSRKSVGGFVRRILIDLLFNYNEQISFGNKR